MTENNTLGNGMELSLEDILKTLSSLPPLPQPSNEASQEQQRQQLPSEHTYNPFQPYPAVQPQAIQGYHPPAQVVPPLVPQNDRNIPTDPRLQGRSVLPHHRHQPPQQPRSNTPKVDPSRSSTITEWKFGLRYVSKVAAQNPAFGPTVQKLIKDQERNVRDWDNGRKRIIEEQIAKRDNERTQRASLTFLQNTPLLRTPELDQEELDQFYHKVHRACKQMTESQSAELKQLGVPFFGVRADLVVLDDEDTTPSENGNGSGTITKKQLVELQRKMLNHLMELYGD